MVQNHKDQDGAGSSIVLDQSQEISSSKLVISQGKDVIRGIQPMFVYQYASTNYCELMEHLEVNENTNVDVFEKTKENYPRSYEYVEAKVNVLDEVPLSYSHQKNLKLDQTRYTTKTRDHELGILR
jgi:hypothetical protein